MPMSGQSVTHAEGARQALNLLTDPRFLCTFVIPLQLVGNEVAQQQRR
jgi:hypothetical protein